MTETSRGGKLPPMMTKFTEKNQKFPGKLGNRMRSNVAIFLACASIAAATWTEQTCAAAELKAETAAAFDAYVKTSEAKMDAELTSRESFLWIEGLSGEERTKVYDELRAGQAVVENVRGSNASGVLAVPGGLIHDWRGVVFVPGIPMAEAIWLLEDYDHDEEYYRPDVVRSKLIARADDNFHVYLRLKRKYVVTAVFDTAYDIRYTTLNVTHAYSRSRSTRIQEVENAGQPDEHDDPPGNDHGFLWRLNSYWRFEQADGGVYIECEAISLTRDVPEGLGWAAKPFLEQIPQESLSFTLAATRAALRKK
ncbi:MAG: hypothetical protein WCA98_05130 [Candidatus Acidiferrales bacterium]